MVFNTRDLVTTVQHTALDAENTFTPWQQFLKGSKMNVLEMYVCTVKDEHYNHGSQTFYLKKR